MSSVVPQDPYNQYNGDGVATVYPYEFQLLTAGDLVVTIDGVVVPTSDFVLTGVGVQVGGDVTFNTAPVNGSDVLLTRVIALERDTDYQYNGALKEATLDNDFNRLWQALQGVGAILGGAVRAPFPEQVSSLPNAAARSNTTLIFDNLGQPTVAPLSGLSVVIGDMSATVVHGDGVTDNAAQITAANALGKPIYFQGVSNPATPVTITVPIRNGLQQIFTPISQVTIDNGLPVRPEWFGSTAGNIARAVNSLPFAAGGTVLLANKTYPPSYNTATGAMLNNRGGTPGVDYMVRKHIRFEGDRLPEFNAGETALQNGTIIQGPLFIGCECDGFQIDNVGVDSGTTVVNALYGGVEQDGLCIVQTNKTVPLTGTQFQIGKVVGLCKIGSTGAHAVLVESVSGGSIGRAEGRRGYHGVAIKSRHLSIGALVGHGCGGEDVIIKGDTYAVCSELQIDSIASGGLTGVETGVGVQIQAGTSSMGSVQIGSIFTLRKDWGLVVVAGGNVIADVEVGRVLSQSCAAGGMQLSGDCRRVRVGNAEFNASPSGLYVTGASSLSNHIDNLAVANCTTGVFCDAKISIGDAHFDTVTTALSYSGGANINLSRYTGVAVTNFWNINPALAGTWVSHAGGDAFKATLDNGKVVLSGLIQSGAAATLVSALAANIRPTQNYRFCCLGYNGAAWAPIEVVVTTTGVVSASNFAAASSYLSLSGVQWPIPF